MRRLYGFKSSRPLTRNQPIRAPDPNILTAKPRGNGGCGVAHGHHPLLRAGDTGTEQPCPARSIQGKRDRKGFEPRKPLFRVKKPLFQGQFVRDDGSPGDGLSCRIAGVWTGTRQWHGPCICCPGGRVIPELPPVTSRRSSCPNGPSSHLGVVPQPFMLHRPSRGLSCDGRPLRNDG